MLLVGESGLGKTTFVRNLFAAYAMDPNFPVNDAGAKDARQVCIKVSSVCYFSGLCTCYSVTQVLQSVAGRQKFTMEQVCCFLQPRFAVEP